MTSAFIFFVAFIGTLLSAMSGVGTGIITVPAWLSLGYPFPAAVACNKVAGVVWVPISARTYLKDRSVEWNLLIPMSVLGLFGTWAGAQMTISVSEHILRRILGVILIFVSVWSLRHKQMGLEERPAVKGGATWLKVAALPLGFYEGFFGTGNGIFATLAFVKLRGLDFIRAMGHYHCLAFLWCLFAAIFYGEHGFIDLQLVVPATLGSIIGSFAGAKLATRGGTVLMKRAFVSCGFLFGSILLIGIL